MKLVLDNKKFVELMREVPKSISKKVIEEYQVPFTRKLLDRACPQIEVLLKSASMLPKKDGLSMFYDTESDRAKEYNKKRPFTWKWNAPKNTNDKHLIDLWEVSWFMRKGGAGGGTRAVIVIKNSKLVRGKSKVFNLFELLWNGTETYVVPERLSIAEYAALKAKGSHLPVQWQKYMANEPVRWGIPKLGNLVPLEKRARPNARTETHMVDGKWVRTMSLDTLSTKGLNQKRSRRKREILEPYTINFNEDADTQPAKRMSYYNRYMGRFYYNQQMRRGIERDVVDEFHDYVADCIHQGLQFAMGELKADKKNIKRNLNRGSNG